MSVELKNWKELCKEKDERIKELEGKLDLIVERLEEDYVDARNSVDIEEDYYLGMCQGLQYAICHVKEVGGMNE